MGILCLSILAYVSVSMYTSHSNISFIEKATSIKLPSGTKKIQVIDNGETYITAKFIIPVTFIDSLISRFSLKPLNVLNSSQDIQTRINYIYNQLDSINIPKVTQQNDYYLLSNHNKWQAWIVLLKKNTAELWIRVDYPDMKGTPLNGNFKL